MKAAVTVNHVIAGLGVHSRIDRVAEINQRLGVLHIEVAEIVNCRIAVGAQGTYNLGHRVRGQNHIGGTALISGEIEFLIAVHGLLGGGLILVQLRVGHRRQRDRRCFCGLCFSLGTPC